MRRKWVVILVVVILALIGLGAASVFSSKHERNVRIAAAETKMVSDLRWLAEHVESRDFETMTGYCTEGGGESGHGPKIFEQRDFALMCAVGYLNGPGDKPGERAEGWHVTVIIFKNAADARAFMVSWRPERVTEHVLTRRLVAENQY